MTNEEFMIDKIHDLHGAKIDGACSTPDGDFFGIIIKKGKQRTVLWVNCDSEGNGSGWLDIEKI